MAATPLAAADAGLCVVFKGLFYEQTGPTTISPRAGTDFASFRAFASMTSPGSLSSGTIRNPANQTFPLEADGNELGFGMDFTSQANLDAAFGNGNYILSLVTRNHGTRTFTLNLSGNTYPPTPQVMNYTALQAVNPAESFTLQWTPWAGGTTNDIILVQIEDPQTWDMVFSSPMPGMAGALNGTVSSVTIPPNTFSPNRTYNVMLLFFRPTAVDMTSYPGALAAAGYVKETQMPLITTGLTPDTENPWLEEQSPRYGERDVPRNAGVAFQFSEPMQSAVAIQWTPSLTFTYQWNPDRTVLFCFPATGLLPANTEICYTLNPAGQTGFRDVAGNPLPMIQGQFTTGSASSSPDVAVYVLAKQAYYQQTGANTISASTNEGPFEFSAFVEISVPASVTNATLTGVRDLQLVLDGDEWEGEVRADTLGQIDAAYPPGQYTFTIQTVHDGVRQISLNLPTTTMPNAPRLINFNAAQAIDPQAPFTLQWEPFVGATTNDRIQVEIEVVNPWFSSTVFESPDPFSPNALNGTATSLQIPAGTLPPGRRFMAYIGFIKVAALNTNSYPGAFGVVAFVSDTTVPLATTGQPLRPSLRNVQHRGNYVRFECQGEPNIPYTVEFTEDFRQWYPLRSHWNQSGLLTIEDWNLSPTRRFYRVREGW